jgi:hypothetical protein
MITRRVYIVLAGALVVLSSSVVLYANSPLQTAQLSRDRMRRELIVSFQKGTTRAAAQSIADDVSGTLEQYDPDLSDGVIYVPDPTRVDAVMSQLQGLSSIRHVQQDSDVMKLY